MVEIGTDAAEEDACGHGRGVDLDLIAVDVEEGPSADWLCVKGGAKASMCARLGVGERSTARSDTSRNETLQDGPCDITG